MFGFSVKNLQNGFGSPRSPTPSTIARVESSSPQTDVGEIDTRAPFESVKAAVSLFGESISPRARPVTKKTKAEEQKLLERETQHHMVIKELEFYKDQLRSAENDKAQAKEDLHKANLALQDLTGKLENLSESKQAAIKATEAMKRRAAELEVQQTEAQMGNDAWKLELDLERERYKASSGELIVAKQELANLRQDFDAALGAKLTAFQRIEDARQSTKASGDRQSMLSKEVSMLRRALDQVKFDSLQAQEEHLKLIAEKEVHLLVHKSAKEVAEMEIKALREVYTPEENLGRKLEEATEAIKLLQEQLNDVRASDLNSLQTALSELDCARKELQQLLAEERSLRATVESLEQELEKLKRDHTECEKKLAEAELDIEQMRLDLAERTVELETAQSRNIREEMQSALDNLLAQVQTERSQAEKFHNDVQLLRQQTEEAKVTAKETDEKLQLALQEAEEAKAAQKRADDQIRDSPKANSAANLKGPGPASSRKIRLSVAEFKTMNHKIEESRTNADSKVQSLTVDLNKIKASQNETAQKAEVILKQSEDLQLEIEDAIKRTEVAEAGRKVVEGELQKCRIVVGEPSGILKMTITPA
ncbi:WEB family protein At1g12150-like [Salvia hispanica]|uniref:WEB family protein At1g12150-like n=1 Tax=Salvia hispanica TaxID=49212 RepID=UPI0020097959|nr:WEB family protein At1g12150-like [Salvia hispanica]